MKKVFLVQIILMLFACSVTTNAQSDKKYQKALDKVYKTRYKELKKDGWKVSGTSLTLEVALMKHMRALKSDEKNRELVTTVSMCKSLNVCKATALNNALVEYAQKAASYVRGRVVSDMFNNSSAEVPEEFDKLYAGFERLVSGEIKGEVEFDFAVEKDNAGGGKSYQAFFLVNEENASKARLRALQRAFEETKIAQEYANQVANFVREGFE